mgnify:CR=1 FL=1
MSKKIKKAAKELQRLQQMYGNTAKPDEQPKVSIDKEIENTEPTGEIAIARLTKYQLIKRDLIFLLILVVIMIAVLIGINYVLASTGLGMVLIKLLARIF